MAAEGKIDSQNRHKMDVKILKSDAQTNLRLNEIVLSNISNTDKAPSECKYLPASPQRPNNVTVKTLVYNELNQSP